MRNHEHEVTDELLNGAGQQAMRQLVGDLPDETLSLAWRSSLNEKLMQTAARNRRRRWFSLTFAPAMGVAVTAALAVVVISSQALKTPGVARQQSAQVEAALVSAHRQMDLLTDVTGSGLSPSEAAAVTSGPVEPTFDQVDIESL